VQCGKNAELSFKTYLYKNLQFVMGLIYAAIELINGNDLYDASKHRIGEEEVRRMRINMLVDSGAYMLAINESIQEQMQFPVVEKRKAELANGHIVECDVVTAVEVRFKNRQTTCRAMVLPGDNEPLLGAMPMEDMDVLIHPLRQELIVNPKHPFFAQLKMK
jgi:clan AA aspartic protease